MRMSHSAVLLTLGLLIGIADQARAQTYGSRLGVQRGGRTTFEPQGAGVLFDALDPAVRRWYIPQELYNEYRWQQWEITASLHGARSMSSVSVGISVSPHDLWGRATPGVGAGGPCWTVAASPAGVA